jgi:hypothetical protein
VPKLNGSGTTTVDILTLIEQINQGKTDDEQALRTLAWMWNQDLPKLPIQVGQSQSFITTDDWKIPEKDAPVMSLGAPGIFLPKFGELKAETK